MFTDGTTTYSYDTLVAGLILQSTPVDWWCLYWIHGDTAWVPLSNIPNDYDELLEQFHHHHTSQPWPSTAAFKAKAQNPINNLSVRADPRLGAYATSGYLRSSNISTRGHSRGTGPC